MYTEMMSVFITGCDLSCSTAAEFSMLLYVVYLEFMLDVNNFTLNLDFHLLGSMLL